MSSEEKEGSAKVLRPYTVSAVYDDGFEAVIKHLLAADAQAARDQVIMDTGGRVIIASVFAGHLAEPDAVIFHVERASDWDDSDSEEDAGGR